MTHSIFALHGEATDWVGDGATSHWSDNGNWSLGIPLANNPNDPVPVFMVGNPFGGGRTTSVADHDWHIRQLTFANHLLSNNVYTISGSPLTIHGGGVSNQSGVNGQLVNNDITLVSPSNGPGNIWHVDNDMIVAGDIGGDAMLRKFGNGKLSLRGHVTLDNFVVIEGTVRLGLGDILADNVHVDVPGLGRLETASTGSETIGSFSGYGHVVLNSHLAIGSANTVDGFYGRFSGSGGWTKVGTGEMFLDHTINNPAPHHTYTGPTTVDGGLLEVRSRARLPNASQLVVNSAGTFRLSGPTDAVRGLDGDGIVDLNGGHLVLGNFISTGNYPGDGNFSGLIEGTGALSKRGAGTQTLGGASTYSGNTTVSEGTLVVANTSGSATGSGTVTVAAAGTLSGSGRVGGQLNVSGTISPGHAAESTGALTVNNMTLQTSAKTLLEIDGTIPGSDYDQILANAATLAGTLDIVLGPHYEEPTTRGQWDEYTLIQSAMLTGQFDNVRYDGALIDLGYIQGHTAGDGFFRLFSGDDSALTLVNYLALPGDANGDGLVDGQDFIIWNSNKFQTGTDWTSADFNSDGLTDGQDFLLWNEYKFTLAGGAGIPNAVPEPHGCLWLVLTVISLATRWKLLPSES